MFISRKKININNLYRSVRINKNCFVKELLNKTSGFEHAYIGISFIKDYRRFIKIINTSNKLNGEFQYFEELNKEKKFCVKKLMNGTI